MAKYKCNECKQEFTNKIDLACHICDDDKDDCSKEKEDYD